MEQQYKFNLPHRVDNSITVWEEFKDITAKYDCISLGEGAPATMPPQFLVDELVKAIGEGHNQYTRAFGNPLLAQKIAEVYGKKLNRKIDAMSEVNIGVGAYYVISDLLMTFINPTEKEEVVVFEPSYPCYYDHI
jgi:aspartate/methionine/tyrosine aminotransferase